MEKEEREAIFKAHPRPDAKACAVPMPDKYITDFLGNKFPKDQDAQDKKIQASVLAITRPLTSAWQTLLEASVGEDTDLRVPATDVVDMIQRTICMIGNSSELISQKRRANILAAIDRSWGKFSTEKFTDKEMLFGEKFQSRLTDRVDTETALAKAVSITKCHKEKESFSRREGQRSEKFFRQGPAVKYGDGRAEDPCRTANRDTHSGEDTAKEGSIQDQDKSPTSTSPDSHRIKQATDQTTTKKPESHRGDSRSSSISTSKQITRRRNTIRLGYIREKWGETSGRSAGILLPKLGKAHNRSLGTRGGIRISPRASLHTSPKEVAEGTWNGQTKVSSPLKGDRSANQKESSNPSPSSRRKLHQPNDPCTKRRRSMETSDRFERAESIRGPTPLQDGRNHSDEGFGTEGRLDGETRHEGCLLISPHIPSTSKIPQVPMAREDLGIQESSFRTTECPSCVHKASKTNCCIVEEAGHKMYFISGRHADYVSIQGGSTITASNSNRIANLTGIHNQHWDFEYNRCPWLSRSRS